MMNKKKRHALDYLIICVIAVLGAFNYQIFVFPNDFAPSGINGILTIIRHLFGINFGMMYLVLNVPLLMVAHHLIHGRYALNTFVYVVVFSITSMILKNVDLSVLSFNGQDAGERIMAAVAAGVFSGFNYGLTMRMGGCTGGMDIVGSIVSHKNPEINMVWLVFSINVAVAVLSFFAYGMNYVPVILCIIYSFVTSRVGDFILKGARSAAKFEIMTVISGLWTVGRSVRGDNIAPLFGQWLLNAGETPAHRTVHCTLYTVHCPQSTVHSSVSGLALARRSRCVARRGRQQALLPGGVVSRR